MVRIEIPIYGDLRESLSKLLEVTQPVSYEVTTKRADENLARAAEKLFAARGDAEAARARRTETWLRRNSTSRFGTWLRRIFNRLRRDSLQSLPAPVDPEMADSTQAPAARPRITIRELRVDAVFGLTIKIWADEHPPPHFHVTYQGEDASFSIVDCTRLPGVVGLERYERKIRDWWRENQRLLVEKWNISRPANCPIGPLELPPT